MIDKKTMNEIINKVINELQVYKKLETFIDELLLKRGIRLKKDDRYSIENNIADVSTAFMYNPENLSYDTFEILYLSTIVVYKDFLEKRGWPEKEIKEFCREIKTKYQQLQKELQKEIVPYII